MKKAKTIILGASHWHVPLLADRIAEQHDVVGVSDPDPSRTQQLARLWDAPLYPAWEEVLAAHGDAELVEPDRRAASGIDQQRLVARLHQRAWPERCR